MKTLIKNKYMIFSMTFSCNIVCRKQIKTFSQPAKMMFRNFSGKLHWLPDKVFAPQLCKHKNSITYTTLYMSHSAYILKIVSQLPKRTFSILFLLGHAIVEDQKTTKIINHNRQHRTNYDFQCTRYSFSSKKKSF